MTHSQDAAARLAEEVLNEDSKCRHCRGSGSVSIPCPDESEWCGVLHQGRCPSCAGTGKRNGGKVSEVARAVKALIEELSEIKRRVADGEELEPCEGCQDIATKHDSDRVPLCGACYDAMIADQAVIAEHTLGFDALAAGGGESETPA